MKSQHFSLVVGCRDPRLPTKAIVFKQRCCEFISLSYSVCRIWGTYCEKVSRKPDKTYFGVTCTVRREALNPESTHTHTLTIKPPCLSVCWMLINWNKCIEKTLSSITANVAEITTCRRVSVKHIHNGKSLSIRRYNYRRNKHKQNIVILSQWKIIAVMYST